MERRMYDRSAIAFQVRATEVTNPNVSCEGETIDISRFGMAVALPVHLRPGSLFRLEIADSVLLGFVTASREWPPLSEPSFARNKSWTGGSDSSGDEHTPKRRFRTGFEIVEVSIGTSGLSHLLREYFDETVLGQQLATSESH